MKVKELIARLQTLDPEAEIMVEYDGHLYEPIPVPSRLERYGRYPSGTYLFLGKTGLDQQDIARWHESPDSYDKEFDANTIALHKWNDYLAESAKPYLTHIAKGVAENIFPDDPDFAQRATDLQILHRLGFHVDTPTDGTPI